MPGDGSFVDEGFRRALVLHFLHVESLRAALEQVIEESGARDDDEENQEISPAVTTILDRWDLSIELLASVERFGAVGSYAQAIGFVVPLWDGSADPFHIGSFADLAKLPNLEEFEYVGDRETIVDTIPLQDLPKLRKVTVYQGAHDATVANRKIVDALVASGFRVSYNGDIATLER